MKKSTKCILFTLGVSIAGIYTYNKFIEKTASQKNLLSDTEVKSSFIQQNDNEFIVNLRVIENQSNLIDLNLNVSSQKQAQLICNNWKKNASYMYAEIIDLLIKENH